MTTVVLHVHMTWWQLLAVLLGGAVVSAFAHGVIERLAQRRYERRRE